MTNLKMEPMMKPMMKRMEPMMKSEHNDNKSKMDKKKKILKKAIHPYMSK